MSWLLLLTACFTPEPEAPEPEAPVAAPAPAPPATSPGYRLALTFDDLPYQTWEKGAALELDPAVQNATTTAILEALGARPATVFVNCGNLEDRSLVERWRSAGHTIGNHTSHHRSAAHGELDAWMADVRACDDLWTEGDTAPRWFRFPYLWRGETIERRDAVLAGLAEAGYTPVPVTFDSHDWLFESTRREHPDRAQALGEAYVANVLDAAREARAISREKLEREAPQILLLHVNAITATHLPALLAGLEADGAQIVGVDEVMKDPLYAQPDAWAGRGSRWWFARTTPLERPDGEPWYVDREARIQAQVAEL